MSTIHFQQINLCLTSVVEYVDNANRPGHRESRGSKSHWIEAIVTNVFILAIKINWFL